MYTTTNNNETAIPAKKDFATRVDEFMQKFKATATPVARGFVKGYIGFCRELGKLCDAILNLAVKMSIIAIATILIYNFLQANPDIASEVSSYANNLRSAIGDAFEAIRNSLTLFR